MNNSSKKYPRYKFVARAILYLESMTFIDYSILCMETNVHEYPRK